MESQMSTVSSKLFPSSFEASLLIFDYFMIGSIRVPAHNIQNQKVNMREYKLYQEYYRLDFVHEFKML